MGVGCILRVSWICLLLFGGSVAIQPMKGYNYPYTNANQNIGAQDEQLESSLDKGLSSHGQASSYADRSYRAPVAPPPQQLLMTPRKGAFGKRRSIVKDFGLVNGRKVNWELFMPDEPITFPLNAVYQLAEGIDYQSGIELPITPADGFSELPPPSSNPGHSVFPSFEPSSDPIPPVDQFANSEATSIPQNFEDDPISSNGGFGTSQNINYQGGVQDGSQSYSPNLDVLQYPSPENAQLPYKEVDHSNYDTVNVIQPSTWSSASFVSEEEPVFSSDLANTAQAAPVEIPAAPSYVNDLTVDSTSSKDSAQPIRFRPVKVPPQLPRPQQLETPQKVSKPLPSTYIVQSKGGYHRGRKAFSKTRYSRTVPPPPQFGLKG